MTRQRSRYHNSKASKGLSKYDRLDYLQFAFVGLGAIIALRLFIVEVIQHGSYEALAENRHQLHEDLFPERGEILVHDRYSQSGVVPIATNKVFYEVHAEPKHVVDAQATADALSPLLSISKEDLLKKLDKPDDPEELLKRRVSEEVVNAIKDLDLKGLYFQEEQWRYYPEGEYMAHLTGYFGYSDTDKVGQYGLEGYYNKELSGQIGHINGEKDGLGRFLTIGDNFIQAAVDGDDLVLTIDKNIQYNACTKLKAETERLQAKESSLIIMDPATGAIIAMCDYPTYDPNNYNDVESVNVFTNSAVSNAYEPGSVFKAITMAAGLDTGSVTPTTTYNDSGEVKVAGFPIHNFDGRSYGTQPMTVVLEKSLNLGTIFVVQQTGNEAFRDYVHNFGFGEPTGIELSNEQSGDVSSLDSLKDVYSYTGSFGHGITVTPLQMITAYAAIANQGKLMKPYVIEKRVVSSGAEIPTQPTAVRQAISAATARTLTAMLVNVVDTGTAHVIHQKIPNYYIAGKTGTALVVNENGKYDLSRHNDTMVGYGPVSDPKFVMLIKMNEPHTQYAEGSVVPIWADIAKDLINYEQIPPDRE